MVDPTVYYTPNSFGLQPCDKEYILNEPGPLANFSGIHRANMRNEYGMQVPQGEPAPSPYYRQDQHLPQITSMNTADINAIMDGKIKQVPANLNPLLQDPILQKAIQTDSSVRATIKDDPINFPPEPGKLIMEGTANTNNETLVVETFGATPEKSDPFWLIDPWVLFRDGNYYRIFPTESMSRVEMLNALTRFFLYVGVLYLIFYPNSQYIYIPVVVILIIIFIYFIQKNEKKLDTNTAKPENFVELKNDPVSKVCQLPTKGNPFMNVTMADWMDRRNRPSACDPNNEKISNQINQYFDYNLFRNVEDVYNRGYEQRQFYTTPSTTIPNDQTTFAKWLYQLPQTCKENTTNCLRYEDIRYTRFSPYIDRMVPIRDDTLE